MIARMVRRRLSALAQRRLGEFPAVALVGPRQVGKTTLARSLPFLGGSGPAPEYLDLENPADLARLQDASSDLRSRGDRLVIIDEVQRAPGLFQVLRGIVDERALEGTQVIAVGQSR